MLVTLFLLRIAVFALSCSAAETVTFHAIHNYPYPSYPSVLRFATEVINSDSSILPQIIVNVESTLLRDTPAVVVAMMEFDVNNETLILGNERASVAERTGIVGDIFGIAQLSPTAQVGSLSNKQSYPYFSRVVASGDSHIFAIQDVITHYHEIGGRGWNDVAVLTHTDNYGVALAEKFIETVNDDINVLTYQQFLFRSFTFDQELEEISKSGARVILAFLYSTTWDELITTANEYGLVGENYVWIVSASLVGSPVFSLNSDEILQLTRGVVSVFDYIAHEGPVYDNFIEQWMSLDVEEYPGAGVMPSDYTLLEYDQMMTVAHAAHYLNNREELDQSRIPAESWTNAIRNVDFEGVTGRIHINSQGDRESMFSVRYYDPEAKQWQLSALWSESEGIQQIHDIVWFSNTTQIPDLDIRGPFDYWSCNDKMEKTDKTGKTIKLQSPDGSDVDAIASHYHCDNFIDCKNLSDESEDCTTNFTNVFIAFGVITGICILLCVALFVFVALFGLVLKYQSLRVSSPVFLIIMLVSMIVGFSSIFAWFGKPHPVACAFQPWLLGLSTISMISALCVKIFRIWRIFRSELKKKKITDLKLLGFWAVMLVPAIIIVILWTIISTPTASMQEREGEDHYVCTTGGFTGEPGGIIFFAILVFYGAIVLLIGVFLSVVTRNVPSTFNESKLLIISIYNLGFLSIVIIPVFLVVQPFNPFIAWILRTSAILYAFGATLLLQFVPPVFRIVFINRLQNKKIVSTISSTTPKEFTPTATSF